MYELSDIRIVRNERTILSLDKLSIPTDRLTVVLGHNGSGKSTLASVLSGLVKPDTGDVKLEGADIFRMPERERAKKVAFLPQKLPASAGLTCKEVVRLGRYPWRGLFGRWQTEDETCVLEALKATQTERFKNSFADDLSGGERQRVWIAMLLAQSSPVMILDEPTSALDVKHQYGVLQLLEQINRTEKRGVITIIHDINLALRFAQHVIALKHGKLLFEGSADLLRDEAHLKALFETEVKLIAHPQPPADYAQAHQNKNLEVAVVCA